MSIFGQPLAVVFVIVGAGLILAEAGIPGAHFIVLGVSMFGAGLMGMVLPETLTSPLTLAGLTLANGIIAFVAYKRLGIYKTDESQTKDSDSIIGTVGVVTETVTSSSGYVELETTGFTTDYSARTEVGELPRGERVIVTDGRGGNIVTVESLEE